ncbi:AMP-binding protein [Roseisolibacter sp. H3M3-2]|uniref:AMP-binding protein n=1 Tax=Roseisolibacter sp. H3M3-2 TaxID=3031323 RepID=UPI0023DAFE5E|nr:AMP-binding protein [Roseisolibacter sp. H3M3-2]MDF1501587.1 AMP-binding protein [Roseisolibacter sp. H3M3-2]
MTDPLAVLPLAAAAAGGRVDQHDAARLVAAGLTLLRRSAALVRALQDRRSAILLPTSPAFLVALAASEGRGAVLVNPLAAPPEVAHQLRDAGVGVVFTNAALAPRLPAGTPHVLLDDAPRTARLVVGDAPRDVSLETPMGDALDLEGSEEAEGRDEEAAVVYTSAMDGTPLGAIVTHRNLLSNARATVDAARIAADEHALAVLPFSHLFGLVVAAVAPLLAGGRVTTMDRFHPIRAVELIEREGITLLVGVPAVFAALLQVVERRGTRLQAPALRLCICGGAPLDVALQMRWEAATGVALRQGYGLTEAGPVCLFNRCDQPNRLGTLGVPFPGVEVEARDVATGAPLPDGVEGELCVRGPNVGPGYVGGARGLGRHGEWLRTGDRGVRHPDGTIAFRGVLKAMFTRNGFNIYPREIERAVRELPGVRTATVRAVPDPAREHDIALHVTGDVGADAVKRWCAERLSAYKQPAEVTVG